MSHPTQYWHTWKLSLMLLMTPVLFLLWHVKRINMNKGLLGHYYLTTALSDWLHHEYTIRIEDNINILVVVLFSAASKGFSPTLTQTALLLTLTLGMTKKNLEPKLIYFILFTYFRCIAAVAGMMQPLNAGWQSPLIRYDFIVISCQTTKL